MKRAIGVVGAGSWGTTLAKILGENGKETLLWAREEEVWREINEAHTNSRFLPGHELPQVVEATGDLERICTSCDLLLMVVPSHGTRAVARQMGEHLQGDQLLVHCTKGIEIETFKRMSEVLREETCLRKIGVLCGPNLSKELAARNPAGTLVASKYDEVVRAAQDALHNQYFRVYGGRDVVGAEVGGSFKNIVAVAAGVVDGLKMGDNTKALLLTRSLNEMARLGAAMGAELVTFGGMAGVGDLMATCFSPLSRNHQVGERLAQGQTLDEIQRGMFMVAEGVKTTRAVHLYAARGGLDLPIVRGVHAMLYEGLTVRDALGQLMARQTGREFPGLVLS
jgi:glycerol-3-phosphate dehydrogenase (NAD(P)+)